MIKQRHKLPVPTPEYQTTPGQRGEHVKVDPKHPVGYGMPEKALILHWNGPVFEISDKVNSEKYHTVVRFEKEKLLKSGLLVGGKMIVGKAAMNDRAGRQG